MNIKSIITFLSFTVVGFAAAQNRGPANGYLKALSCARTSLNYKLCLSELVYPAVSNLPEIGKPGANKAQKTQANVGTAIVLPSVIRDDFYLTLQRNSLANTAIHLERAEEVYAAICRIDQVNGGCMPPPPATKHIFTGSIIAREGAYLVPVHYTLEINKVSGKSTLMINGKAHGQSFWINLKDIKAPWGSGNEGTGPQGPVGEAGPEKN